ncbi:MAG: RNA polymerase sigma factor [Clostridiales bacterium]|jgi:RNA polymerase sigma-70 factor (ECF subfamily)|nr:RNA polymerase sigma factor [Clostridiales bacterium]
MEDSMILEMFFRRQETAIAETRRKYGKRLFRTSMNILHSNEDAEECVNDTLFKAWEAIPPSRPTMFGAYLVKIARNLSINKWEIRSAAKRGGGEVNLLLSELEECLPSAGGPEQEHEAALVTGAINTFLDNIDKTARVAFVLRYFHGESIRAISDRFQMSESKIKSILFRARKKLRTHLEKEGVVI